MKAAKGEFVAYLDGNSEFEADYFEQITTAGNARRTYSSSTITWSKRPLLPPLASNTNAEKVTFWSPGGKLRDNLFALDIAKLLGVAHRRELWQRVGGFNDLLWEGVGVGTS